MLSCHTESPPLSWTSSLFHQWDPVGVNLLPEEEEKFLLVDDAPTEPMHGWSSQHWSWLLFWSLSICPVIISWSTSRVSRVLSRLRYSINSPAIQDGLHIILDLQWGREEGRSHIQSSPCYVLSSLSCTPTLSKHNFWSGAKKQVIFNLPFRLLV
jgi:hypothetical protein